ncbi:MAG: metalloregulator ArsR/SmtB family transcription factor [Chloroflexi bacterium]|nr:metalloregulator ArsR/SmtB family transcription factor [Chloroflexota bacterium]
MQPKVIVWDDKRLRDILKILADDTRLHLFRLLNEREYAVGELAAAVALTEPTVSHHLARLREVGLVTLRMAGNSRYYTVNAVGLGHFKRLVAEVEKLPPPLEDTPSDDTWIDALDWATPEDRETLHEFTHSGRLTNLPRQQKRLMPILRWLASKFEVDRLYTEREINAILKDAYAHDFVSLRRDLVDFKYLRREANGTKYWATGKQD